MKRHKKHHNRSRAVNGKHGGMKESPVHKPALSDRNISTLKTPAKETVYIKKQQPLLKRITHESTSCIFSLVQVPLSVNRKLDHRPFRIRNAEPSPVVKAPTPHTWAGFRVPCFTDRSGRTPVSAAKRCDQKLVYRNYQKTHRFRQNSTFNFVLLLSVFILLLNRLCIKQNIS